MNPTLYESISVTWAIDNIDNNTLIKRLFKFHAVFSNSDTIRYICCRKKVAAVKSEKLKFFIIEYYNISKIYSVHFHLFYLFNLSYFYFSYSCFSVINMVLGGDGWWWVVVGGSGYILAGGGWWHSLV